MKYTPMLIHCDLAAETLNWAMASTEVPIYLHVHPSMVSHAQEVVDYPAPPGRRIKPEVVADDTLGINEWYLVTSIGSNPA
jgi:hypothetical protein